MLSALVAGAAWMVVDRRAGDIAAAEHEAASLTVVLAEQTSLTFGGVDFVVRDLRQRIRAMGIASPEAFAERLGTPEIQQMLHDEAAGLRQTDAIVLVGADGRLVNFSRHWPVPAISIADRGFFRTLRDDPSVGLVISDPMASQTTGRPTIFLARRIDAPDGRFLGLAMGAIRLDYFADLYRSLSEGDGRWVSLRARDGTLLARYPQTVGQLGMIPTDDELMDDIQRGAPGGGMLAASPFDGFRRLRSARALKDFPLVVVIAQDEAVILAPWRRLAVGIAAGAGLAAAALAVAIALLARQIARREDSEAALAATLGHVSQGIMMIRADRRIPVCNRRAMALLGLPPAVMAGKPTFDDILRLQWERGDFHGDNDADGDAQRKYDRAAIVLHERQAYERRQPNGTVLEINSIPLPDGGVVRTYTDVTAMREREAALRAALAARDSAEAAFPQQRARLEREMAERARPLAASEARHRDVAEVASDWIWETDTTLRFTFLSKRFGDTSGLPWSAVNGTAFGDLVALGFDPAGMAELRATMDAGGVFQDVINRVEPDGGGARFWRMSGTPFSDTATGIYAGYRGTGSDVTAAIEHEAALKATVARAEAAEREARDARTRLAEAIEAIPEGIVLFDAKDRLVLCNSGYTAIYPPIADIMKPGVRFADLLHAGAACGVFLLDGLDGDIWVRERLARHRNKSGNREEQRLADGRVLQVTERHTSDGGSVGIRIDVTEAHRRAAAEREREKLAALGHLAGGVAHEINNLLQPAITFPELVRDRLPPDDIESRADLDCVLEGARKIREIVRNILLFARKEEPRLVPLDLIAELRAALGFVRDLMPPAVTVAENDLAAHAGCLVAANKTQLTQVITNLLVNAAQAIVGTGTVTVSVTQTEPTDEEAAALGVAAGRGYIAVAIADTGSGMDPATMARIFEPFFTTKPVGQGTGLGLSVAYGILRSWQGAITVRSAIGQGTEFTLTIPVLSEADAIAG